MATSLVPNIGAVNFDDGLNKTNLVEGNYN